ncbi:hypothetical protein B0H16DRAFT_1478397 [Mycena metata]|uniref:Uncharacterized protein n=1 Tax=Mycena metata TaxID=1033252 RepID=A0AAD7H7A7_9AGAR|nr:hypothetical protein B0H16DRAFT_1478397 [Mycena metata]
MPPLKKKFRDRVSRLHGGVASPKHVAVKRVAAIALSPVKARPQKKPRDQGPEDNHSTTSMDSDIEEMAPGLDMEEITPVSDKEDMDVFSDDTNLGAQYQHAFHQGSTPETPTGAPMAFNLKGKLPRNTDPRRDDDNVSINTFPGSRAPSILESDDGDDMDNEMVPPEQDELRVPEAGGFGGDGYPRPAPPQAFVEKMAAIGKKQALAAAPNITSAKAALTDIELTLQGPSRGKSGGFTPPDLSPWVRVRMEGIRSHLAQYTNPNSVTYGKWGLSARQAAIGAGRDVYFSAASILPVGKYFQSTRMERGINQCSPTRI